MGEAGAIILGGGWWPFAAFWAFLVVAALGEAALPLYRKPVETRGRLATNFGLGLVNAGLAALAPLSIVLAAAWAEERGIGLLNWLALPAAAAAAVTILSLSLTMYWVHRLEHRVGWLWRVHRVHHCDTAMDVSTGFRHHPAELLIATGVAGTLAVGLGWSTSAVIGYETVAAIFALATHVNLRLPPKVDAGLRWLIVTPEMHHVHHSAARHQTDSNYGDVLSIWDRLFGTYRRLGREELIAMRIGLGEDHDEGAGSFSSQLASPFQGENRRAKPAHLPHA